ncbi:MAG: GNAT family N-acetyltransferase [Holosporaceae bacterium]|jgi:GNAT superfamily N-acetyltransferase|nr:GNAT family N-acetyltransferase [Holosporaceae bacterium]
MLQASAIEKILENNFYEKVTFLPRLCSGMKVADGEAISFVDASVSSDTFNVACLRDKQKLSEDDVKKMMEHYAKKNMPFALWVGPQNFDEKIEEILLSANLKCVESELSMAANIQNVIMKFKEIEGLVTKEVSNITEFEDYGFVMASVFDPFDEEAIAFYKKISASYDVKNEKYKMFVGYMHNEPAAICCSVVSDENFGGIYDIVTNPKFQRKGLGTYMTSVAIKNLIAVGCKIVGMQASDDGRHVYQKMGFESFGAFRVYSV